MKLGKLILSYLSFFIVGSAISAEPADLFSRANCLNNESITYNYFDPPEIRTVFSTHYKNGVYKHYVTDANPVACSPATGTVRTASGLFCVYSPHSATRHAGVHGAFLSTEPNPDGNLVPGVTTAWRVVGSHRTMFPWGGSVQVLTNATDCNFHFDQFY